MIWRRGGQPSRVTPTPPPWDSPQVEMRNTLPKEFPVPIVRVNAFVAGSAKRRNAVLRFMLMVESSLCCDDVDVDGLSSLARGSGRRTSQLLHTTYRTDYRRPRFCVQNPTPKNLKDDHGDQQLQRSVYTRPVRHQYSKYQINKETIPTYVNSNKLISIITSIHPFQTSNREHS